MHNHAHQAGHRPYRSILVTLVATLLALVASAGPASAAEPRAAASPRTWTVQVGQESNDGGIQGMAFGPDEIWINEGDTVNWTANSMEIHTVSFFDPATYPNDTFPPFDPTNPAMVARTSETTIDQPGQVRNSGLMTTLDPTSLTYELTFTGTGDFSYVCYVHGKMMMGTVHVRDSGTSYPFSQQKYDAQARQARTKALAAGNLLQADARASSNPHHVYMGAADDTAMVMRFVRPTVRIRAGETVTFDMAKNAAPVPHTVTFGEEQPDPQNPSPFPYGDPTQYEGGNLSSGYLFAEEFAAPPFDQSTFDVTFTKPGTYHYICMLHDEMGMVGTVVVK